MAFRNRERHLPEIPIIPMIDTMFFLLVFFILTSLNIIKLEGINVNLPKADNPNTAAKKNKVDLTVSINSKQQVYVNDKNVTGKDIGPILLGLLQKANMSRDEMSKQPVIINADGSVPHRLVVQCIDQARGSGITKFAIATTKQDQGNPAPVTAP